ncbi:MAG: nickel pincer cofactor biosynthesis protein LarC [Candidatus Aegiribacteria sp.]
MRIAVFDPFCGVSGNMILGALLDSGLDASLLKDMLRGLDLPEWDLSAETVHRGGLKGTHVEVSVPEETAARHLSDILDTVSRSRLPEGVRNNIILAFGKLADAESEAHGIPVDSVHFHEVGAMDAIIDIAGAFCGMHLLGIERVYSTPVATGVGTVECSHGTIPVPAPATLRILTGVPTSPSGIPFEITTPTGAAILATAVQSWTAVPPGMISAATGYGAGTRELSRPNLLRLTLGDTVRKGSWKDDRCVEIRTVLDDLDPRTWPEAAGRILNSGAVDCYASVCIGKKGRPALEVTVICDEPSRDDVVRCIFRNTTTLGVRMDTFSRAVLERDFQRVQTEFGPITMKRAFMDGSLLRAEPEYEECASAAGEHGVSVREVMIAARCAARKDGKGS